MTYSVLYSFVQENFSLNLDIFCSISCGEKSMRFTPTVTIAEMREDIIEKCVNIFRRISCGVIPSILYHLLNDLFLFNPINDAKVLNKSEKTKCFPGWTSASFSPTLPKSPAKDRFPTGNPQQHLL